MNEICADVSSWIAQGARIALATVIKTWGSSPRKQGSVMAVDEKGRMCGSVSGGCVEGAVIRSALECLSENEPRLEMFHATTKSAHEVGLPCGGNIDVFIAEINPFLARLELSLIKSHESYCRFIVVDSDNKKQVGMTIVLVDVRHLSGLPDDLTHNEVVGKDGRCFVFPSEYKNYFSQETLCEMLSKTENGLKKTKNGMIEVGGLGVFYSHLDPSPHLVCVGGVHISVYLTKMAQLLGYRTTVVDPRGIFSTPERFSHVDNLACNWPQKAFQNISLTSSTAICALTHDHKIDVPALGIALDSPAFYIGSLGRYSTQLLRCRALREEGYDDNQISRIHGPIGLDINANDPAEIALSIMSEITAVRNLAEIRTSRMLESEQRVADDGKTGWLSPSKSALGELSG